MLRKVAFCLTLCLLVCLRVAAQDRSTPETTVRSFLTAFGRGDIKQAVVCVKGAQISGPAVEALEQQIRKEPATFTLSDVKTTINGTRATMTAVVSIKSEKEEKAESFPTQLDLVLSEGNWQIIPNSARAQEDKPNVKPDIANALANALADTTVFTKARDAARKTSCLSNLKQIGTAAMMFAQDYDEKFKLKADSYKKSLMPYVKRGDIFQCPTYSGSGASYAFNGNLVGVSQVKIKAPAQTVLFYEGKNGKLDFRHDGKAGVCFADGHAKMIDAAAAKKLQWMP